MEAVKIVAQALNEIFEKNPLIMTRQVKSGQDAGLKVEGVIDLESLPTPKIVMINCSFDSVRYMYVYAHTQLHYTTAFEYEVISVSMVPLFRTHPLSHTLFTVLVPSPDLVFFLFQGMAALGYALDPHKLTQVLNSLQDKCSNIEEVSYNPDQV